MTGLSITLQRPDATSVVEEHRPASRTHGLVLKKSRLEPDLDDYAGWCDLDGPINNAMNQLERAVRYNDQIGKGW